MVALRWFAMLAPIVLGACLLAPPALCDGDYDLAHPRIYGTEINDGNISDSPFLTRDRKDLYFARNSPANTFFVYWSHRDDPAGSWSAAVRLPFDQHANASNPYVTPDGNTLYYTENSLLMQVPRNLATGQFDGTPTGVDRPTNVREMAMTDDQLDMYYENADSGQRLTYHAHRPSVDLEFPDVGTAVSGLMNGESTAPAISSDGRVLLVATPNPHHLYRGIGSGDVFTLDPDPIDLTVETYDGSVTDDTIMIYARGLFAEITSVERTCNN